MSALATVPRETVEAATRLELLPLSSIDVGENVRVDPGELAELVASIAELGVLQPVRAIGPNKDGRYRLVWGQRRYLACSELGLATIPALVQQHDEADKPGPRRSIEQLAENRIRKDLNAIEEAVALRDILGADKTLTQAEVARQLGVSPPWVSNTLRLLEADEVVQAGVRRGVISASHAKSLIVLPADEQRSLATRIENGLSAHQLESELRWRTDQVKQREAAAARTAKAVPKVIAALEAAAVPKTTRVYLQGTYNLDSKPIQTAIKKAGWKLEDAYAWERSEAAKCDCAVVRVVFNRTWKVEPACVDDKHRDRQRNVDHVAERAREKRIDEQVTELTGLIDTALEALRLPPPLLRLMAARNYHDLPELFTAGDDVLHETRAMVAQQLASSASSKYAYGEYRERADEIFAQVIEAFRPAASPDADPEPARKIRKSRTGAGADAPPFTPSQAAAAAAELDADGIT